MMEWSWKAKAHSSRERVETEETEVVPIPIGWTRTYSGVGQPHVGSRVVVGEINTGFSPGAKELSFPAMFTIESVEFYEVSNRRETR